MLLRSKTTGSLVDVLVGDLTADAVLSNPNFKSAPLLPWANRIENATYEFFGEQHTLPVNEPSRGDALHGFVYASDFSVVSTEVGR